MSAPRLSLVLCFSYFIYGCSGLNCHIRTGPGKESQWMNIYRDCVKKQELKNTTGEDHKNENVWTRYEIVPKDKKDQKKIDESIRLSKENTKYNTDQDGVSDRTTTESDYGDEDSTDDDDGDVSTEGEAESSNTSHGEEYMDDVAQYENYRSLSSRLDRQKRAKSKEMNSGQRSQYNPNMKRDSEEDDTNQSADTDQPRKEPKHSRNNACALHCFVEALKMTDATGFPNKYFVRQAITQDIEDQELKDFLNESSDECFQILKANKVDKCEYSRNLLICLSDKGKANCDDWKNDMPEIDLIGIKHFKDLYKYYVLNGLWS
ncbi:general odorant-binding protein 71-like [Battus philenor]|uniref:general odorant-binding protein 71-like n=1 Tax=Battus philenor TaxID=42288 RepID=UPI0035D0EA37